MSSSTTKLKMPFQTWCQIQKLASKLNATRKQKIDIDKYAEVKRGGRLLYDLISVELGARDNIEDVEYYL